MSKAADGRKQLADLALLRFQTCVKDEGKSEAEAFREVVIGLLEAQDELWAQVTDRVLN